MLHQTPGRSPHLWLLVVSVTLTGLIVSGCGDDVGDDDATAPRSERYLGPDPVATAPGELTCQGCPEVDDADVPADYRLTLDGATFHTFTGTVRDAVGDGHFTVISASGQLLGGTIPTDAASGAFEFTAPLFCGQQLVECVWSNDAGQYVVAVKVVTTNCVDPDIRATVTWDEGGSDWELHLVRGAGRINQAPDDCTWTTCIGSGPDWGVPGESGDNPLKDVDNTGAFGPENIYLVGPESTTYTVLVEHWGSGTPDADGVLTLFVGDQQLAIAIDDLAPRHVRTVATIEWPAQTIEVVNADYDCSEAWSSGCTAALP